MQRDSTQLRLPQLGLASWARPARELQRLALQRWKLSTAVIDFLKTEDGSPDCAVSELLSPQNPEGWLAVGLDQLDSSMMTELERGTLEAICIGAGTSQRGPLSRLGWIQEAMGWIRSEVDASTQLTGEIEQHNASSSFALVRFAVTGAPDLWLKATGEPNVHERAVTETLASIGDGPLPRLIASRQDWNAWLMEDAGRPFDPILDRPKWPTAAASMAKLQMASVSCIDQLIAVHAADQRLPILRQHLSELIAYLENAMGQQTSTKVAPITPSRLQEIGRILETACYVMEDFSIPHTILHNDMNIENILVRDQTCVFVDWSEAAVGNPFTTFGHLKMLATSGTDTQEVVTRMTKEYARCWLDYLDPMQIDSACALSSLLAPLAYLYGRGDWFTSAEREEPHRQAHARSIARYIDRAAQSRSVLEACQ